MSATCRYLVEDVDRAVGTYTNAFGFALVQQMGPAFAIVERDGLTVWLSGPLASAAKPMPDGERPTPGGWNRIVISVVDVEAEVVRLRAAGIQMRGEIVHGPGGAQIVVMDGEGNLIELF